MSESVPVLVVEDEAIVNEVLEQIFTETEFTPSFFDSAEAALAAFAPGKWSVALIDKNLPGMSGLELVAKLKVADRDIAAIVMTGYASLDSVVTVLRLGAFDYIAKPFENLGFVIEKVRRGHEHRQIALSQRRLVEELTAANAKLKERNRELAAARDELVRQARMASMGQLASGIAHELNNPLACVKSNTYVIEEYVEFLQRVVDHVIPLKAALDEDPVRRDVLVRALVALPFFDDLAFFSNDTRNAFREVKEGIERAIAIVKRMKEFTYYERVAHEALDLKACVDRAIQIVVGNGRPGVDIATSETHKPVVRGVASQLTQVFINLLLNALAAVESNATAREVRVALYSLDGKAVAEVSDNGNGIPPENLDRIFDPFFTTDEVGRSVGLGLSISSEIVRRYGGSIRVRSTVGKGSTFTVELPLEG